MDKLNAFIGQFVGDLGAARKCRDGGHWGKTRIVQSTRCTAADFGELAKKTQPDERYLREWLGSQAAGCYVTYDEKTNKFSLSEEQAFSLAQEDSPAYVP